MFYSLCEDNRVLPSEELCLSAECDVQLVLDVSKETLAY